MFAAALAVGLVTAPLPQSMSTAIAQQQATKSDKNANTKKEQSAGQLAARERQKKCAAEWKEAKAANKIEKGTGWPKFWSDCNKRLKSASK
jgi:regulator of protease activity HflC (stomatin/prohibitin superfamily)